ncbi:MAG: hypothetical protein ACPG5B_10545 [Chitinophagales bacterium]
MSYKQLFVFVEGIDDERFVEKIIKPFLAEKYSHIKILKYAVMNKQKLKALIQTCQQVPIYDYIFLGDFDSHGDKSHCVSRQKQKIYDKYSECLENEKISIVKEEIESWYLAGIIAGKAKEFKLKEKLFLDTEKITKEAFNQQIPKEFAGKRSAFMVEILKDYDFAKARKCNASLAYFERKFIL